MKRLLSFLLLGLGLPVFGQIAPDANGYYNEALRYSQTFFGGTARFQGVGGANTALGGDVSSAYSNPAGLGFMRKHEISFTPSLSFSNSNANYLGESTPSYHLNFNFNHLALALAFDKGVTTDAIKGQTVAFTMTRTNDFQSRQTYSGVNTKNSLIDYFMERNDGTTPWATLDNQIDNPTSLDGLAYICYLINPYTKDQTKFNSYDSFVPISPTRQSETIRNQGAQNMFNLSYGANFMDRLYFGASLGINYFSFRQKKSYTEDVLNKSLPLSNFTLTENLFQEGAGANISAGFIYRLHDFFRIGASWTSPTVTRITDVYDANLDVNYNNYLFQDATTNKVLNNVYAETLSIQSAYTLISPMKATAGAAIFLGKYGFLTGDLEWVNYSNAQLFDANPNFSLSGDNKTIRNLYRSVLNYRAGAEIRAGQIRLRGGFAYYADPNVSQTTFDRSQLLFTGGFGVRRTTGYWDFTIVQQQNQQAYSPYRVSQDSPQVDFTNNKVRLTFTMGFFF